MSGVQLRVGWRGNGTCNRRNETIPASGNRFHKAGVLGSIAQHFAQAHYGIVQSVVEIDKGIAGPKAIAQFFARDNFARLLKKHDQNLKRLLWKFDSETMLAELASLQIHFENTEMQNSRNRRRATHGSGWEYISARAQGQSWRAGALSFLFSTTTAGMQKCYRLDTSSIALRRYCSADCRGQESPFSAIAEILLRHTVTSKPRNEGNDNGRNDNDRNENDRKKN